MTATSNNDRGSRWDLRLTSEERKALRQTLFGHGFRSAHTFRFWLLLTLSLVIAVMGLTLGSTAVVIGAMLIAPLMEPILASSYAIAVGSSRLMVRTITKVIVASALGFALTALLAALIPGETLTPEVLERTAPDLRDLVVAIAAGIAGAYAVAKNRGAAALPGVAVAVALVPPLGAIGVAFEAGRLGLAQGAALLYVTNLLAITTTGVIVFLAMGLAPRVQDVTRRRWSRLGLVAALFVVLPVGAVLYDQTASISDRNNRQSAALAAVENWLAESPSVEIDEVRLNSTESTVEVDLIGSGDYPPIDELAGDLIAELGEVEVRVSLAQRSLASSSDTPDPSDQLTERINQIAETWIEDFPRDDIRGVAVSTDSIVVEVEGPDQPPPLGRLSTLLSDEGIDLALEIQWTQQRSLNATEIQLQAQRDQIAELATEWATGIDDELTVSNVALEDNVITIDVAGPPIDADPETLEDDIAEMLDEEVEVRVRLTLRVEVTAPANN